MARGGKRDGSGRKKGSLTLRTQETAAQALAEGKSPLDVMLDNMRHFQQTAIDAEEAIKALEADDVESLAGDDPEAQFKFLLGRVKQAASLREQAQICARDAAPYIHPKLSAVSHSGPDGGAIQLVTTIERKIVRPNAADRDG